jgi:hypothetical protein
MQDSPPQLCGALTVKRGSSAAPNRSTGGRDQGEDLSRVAEQPPGEFYSSGLMLQNRNNVFLDLRRDREEHALTLTACYFYGQY